MRVSIVVHHTCASSWKLFRGLRERGLRVELAPAELSHLRGMVLGIPAVFLDDRLMLYDPVTADDVEALIRGTAGGELSEQEAISNFVTGVIYNQALLSLAVLHKSFKPILADRELVEVLTRARFKGRPDVAERARKTLLEQDRRIFDENRERMLKALAYGLVRELYWLGLPLDDADERLVSAWLLAKATVGRIGLQYPRPGVDPAVSTAVVQTLRERGADYLKRIEEEQRAIASDQEFMALFAPR